MVWSHRCRLGGYLLVGLGLASLGRAFVPKPSYAGTGVAALLTAVPSAEAQEFGGGIIAPRGDLFANSEVVLEMRENPPFFAQWPAWMQIAVPAAALLAVAAAIPLFGGEMIDKATIRRAKRREREKKELIEMLQRQVAAAAAAEAAEKAANAEKSAEA
mmetsp:Transcript_76397/g.93833  ORF Transcript_76397/g.93833 Transcript_76397/m.93833 type:complete len:159 (-) Transcript_76397:186-662(-)